MARRTLRREITSTITISAEPQTILAAFFDHDALSRWWRIKRSICVPRALGCYALEWEPSERRDELLGRLGGVFHGTVMTYEPPREFFVAEAYWMAPDGDPVGPMALEVTCTADGAGSLVRVRQSSADTNERWHRYYEAVQEGLTASLARLKTMLEKQS
jgi:uncharacterized protein YndB with AHSA1/START domain